MTLTDSYLIWALGYACYTLGLMHGKGHSHWKNLGMAVVTGILWPIALGYGIYATHFKK